jgi:hypothetical protein
MKQTAVEWLFNQIQKDIIGLEYDYADELNQAKEMEKEQNTKTLDEKIFSLANEFAVKGYGDIAVRLHSIHNLFLKQQDETHGGNK